MRQSFYIIDGPSQIERAYLTPFRPLSSPAGEPTKATYIFVQMLLNLIGRRKPDHLVMAIDSDEAPLIRSQIHPQYRANRQVPDDLRQQQQRIIRLVADAGIPVLALPGYEAGDIIATLAHLLAGHDIDVFLVSRDVRLYQIITDKVRLLDIRADTLLDPTGVEAQYGYPPSKVIEAQTLMGRDVDGVPGIPGVGEKTAPRLIKQYGSVDEVLKHADELPPKLRENIKKSGLLLSMSRQLVTLRCDIPLKVTIEQCRFHGINTDGAARHFRELGLGILLKYIGVESQSTLCVPQSEPQPESMKINPVPHSLPPYQAINPAIYVGAVVGGILGGFFYFSLGWLAHAVFGLGTFGCATTATAITLFSSPKIQNRHIVVPIAVALIILLSVLFIG